MRKRQKQKGRIETGSAREKEPDKRSRNDGAGEKKDNRRS